MEEMKEVFSCKNVGNQEIVGIHAQNVILINYALIVVHL